MKHVDQCEINQEQCINTNMLGVKNILDIIELHKDKLALETTIFVSTDKACSPVNVYGMTKALSESKERYSALKSAILAQELQSDAA